jgi:putative radical SAM enzyme (TIGR03279 family)
LSEIALTHQKGGLVVSEVTLRSPASRSGLQSGDIIRTINGQTIHDIVDFRYHTSEEAFTIEFERNGAIYQTPCTRKWGEDLGLRFTFELADKIHTCDNKCVFCFIHQMPKGMRKSLYLMDDDYRLSFLHGNYVTLTNMSEEEFNRTKEQAMSPLYVSVHASDPHLRAFMLGRTAPEPIIPRLKDLHLSGISVHTQIVLCPGLNDGDNLDQTIADLAELHPQSSGLLAGVKSVAIVPVGLSKYRHNLYPIRRISHAYATKLLKQIRGWHQTLRKHLGTRFVFPSDEWFFYANQPLPSRRWYENFPQFEDGVGTCRLFMDESTQALKSFDPKIKKPFALTLITSVLPEKIIKDFANKLNQFENMNVNVVVVTNQFFGSGITVAGLITGQDLLHTIQTSKTNQLIAVPDISLKDNFLFLDDITIDDVKQKTGLDIRPCPSRARLFLREWLPKTIKSTMEEPSPPDKH